MSLLGEPANRGDGTSTDRATGFRPIPDGIEAAGLPAWLARLVEQDPDAIAVTDRQETLTRTQLQARARGLAARLSRRASGKAPFGVTALLLPHGALSLVGVLGTLQSGDLCVPLDLTHPPARLRALLGIVEPRTIVTDEAHRPAAEALAGRSGSRVVTLEEVAEGGGGDFERRVRFDPDAPAYLLFTSGSSGPPKGIVHAQRSLVHRARCYVNRLRVGPRDRMTWFAVAATGQGTQNLLAATTAGAVLVPYSPREDGLGALPAVLRNQRITITNSSTTLFRTLAHMLRPADVFPDVRVVRVGGERVRRSDVELARTHFPNACFVNIYSSTETSSVAIHSIDPHEPIPGEDDVPVGRPLPGYAVQVVDENGLELPAGEDGEILVRSRYLAIGYWQNAGQTADVFKEDGPPGERSLRSADRGRMRSDGTLLHLGRLDGRVKVRGHRVELAEVERVLSTHPAVRHAVVFVMPAGDGEDQIVACVAGDAASRVSPTELRTFLGQALPQQILPTVISWVADFPLTASGKINRESLKRGHDVSLRATAVADLVEANELERQLSVLWSELLGINCAGRTDDFLTIGGDSLRAGRLLARVFDRWGVELSFAEFLEHPTIAGLAGIIEERSASGRSDR